MREKSRQKGETLTGREAVSTPPGSAKFLHDILIAINHAYADKNRLLFGNYSREFQQLQRTPYAGPLLVHLYELLDDTRRNSFKELVVNSFKVCCQNIMRYHAASLELLEFCAEICPSEITNLMVEKLSKVPDEPAGKGMRNFYLQQYRSILRRTRMEHALKVLEASLTGNK